MSLIRIGLTGSIGAGKSTVGRLFETWGAFRVDADELAREAVRPGSSALARIRAEWGDAITDQAGALDRAAMRRIVAADPAARLKLEGFVHPEVVKLRSVRLAEARERGSQVVVEEVPLLFEVGIEEEFDVRVVVDAPRALRRRRVYESRGLAADEFEALEAAQFPPEEKRCRADHVLWNNGSPEALERQARRVWETVTRADREPPVLRWEVDLHSHTSSSRDCLSRPGEVVRRAREAGLDRIAITDHNEITGARAAADLAPEFVIVGEEIRTGESLDLIGLFLTERIPAGAPFREVADQIHGQGGIVYLPHPFDSHRGAEESFLDGVADTVDLVEGFNARVHDSARNEKAQTWARRHGLPVGAGSDAHLLREIGRGRLRLPPFEGPDDFLCAAAQGSVADSAASGRWVHLGSTWAKLRKRLG